MHTASDLLLTKILATVGPASNAPAVLRRLIEEGARCFRINFSHGGFDDFAQSLAAIRQAEAEAGVPIGVLGDLSGPKIRVSAVAGGALALAAGDHVEITPSPGEDAPPGSRDPDSGVVTLPANYGGIADEVQIGHRVLIDDGAVRMLVTNRITDGENPRLICQCTVGGAVSNKKGINLPDSEIAAPSLTDWDERCAAWAIEHDLDSRALSFVRLPDDIRRLQAYLKTLGRHGTGVRSHTKLPIVAKIEKPQAIRDLDDICELADGLMVARGDLGGEMNLAEVPVMQKRIIEVAHDHGKPVIVATQMLQSMIDAPVPTRAEVSDVANAILDGADALMLSGETAVGRFPVQAVHTMAHTARVTEAYAAPDRKLATRPPRKARESRYRTAALAHGVSVIVKDLDAPYVVMWSELGGGARYISQNRLTVPIIAVSSNRAALRRMSLLFGVVPVLMPRPENTASFITAIDGLFLERGWAEPGTPIVIAKGEPLGAPGVTNKIRIHYLADVCRVTWHAKVDEAS